MPRKQKFTFLCHLDAISAVDEFWLILKTRSE
jgi:hypothetical protein